MKLKSKHSYLIISILTIGMAVLISLVFRTEACIRITGMVLQLLGVYSVIVGIDKTRELFGEPSFYTISRDWLLSLIRKRKKSNLTASASLKMDSNLSAHLSLRHSSMGLKTTLKERVLSLEKNIKYIDEDIKYLQEKVKNQNAELLKTINNKSETNQKEIDKINQKLMESATGGIHISALGASWLFFGVILSSLSNEIACLLN